MLSRTCLTTVRARSSRYPEAAVPKGKAVCARVSAVAYLNGNNGASCIWNYLSGCASPFMTLYKGLRASSKGCLECDRQKTHQWYTCAPRTINTDIPQSIKLELPFACTNGRSLIPSTTDSIDRRYLSNTSLSTFVRLSPCLFRPHTPTSRYVFRLYPHPPALCFHLKPSGVLCLRLMVLLTVVALSKPGFSF